ncbi:MAG: serine/threonine-protein phosphatase [Clostridia bacterium]|nr:serine/threonine-protein phosphatase [Clostridia bacterium]
MIVEYSLCSNVGKVRKENQDTVFVSHNNAIYHKADFVEYSNTSENDSLLIFAVFDGMGGEQNGAEASYIAAFTVSELMKKQQKASLDNMCSVVNKVLCRYMEENGIKSMGTTAAMIKLEEDRVVACNIGDSSIFKMTDCQMDELSVRHIMEVGSGSRVLTQHLGIPENEMQIEPYSVAVKLKENDVFLLCSDGVTDVLNNSELKKIVNEYSVKDLSKSITELAIEKGSKDNISVIVLKIVKE